MRKNGIKDYKPKVSLPDSDENPTNKNKKLKCFHNSKFRGSASTMGESAVEDDRAQGRKMSSNSEGLSSLGDVSCSLLGKRMSEFII